MLFERLGSTEKTKQNKKNLESSQSICTKDTYLYNITLKKFSTYDDTNVYHKKKTNFGLINTVPN